MCPIGNTKFRQAKMVVFHGKVKHKDIIEDTLEIINNNVNKVGENIKLILGTDVIRSGFATSTAELGAEERSIMAMTGHKTTQMVRRYIKEANLFKNNALNKIKI